MIRTRAQAQEHADKHGYKLEEIPGNGIAAQKASDALTRPTERQKSLPKPVKMTRPEKEYGMILEAMKRRGEIVDYRFQGMALAWGADPETGLAMRYKCDWLVVNRVHECFDVPIELAMARMRNGPCDDLPRKVTGADVTLIEVKGAHIWSRDLVRFKGCRAEWPMFQFEMHQLVRGTWTRIL